MTILSDKEIRELCENVDSPMISPYTSVLESKGKISHGPSSYGYDFRLGRDFKIFHNLNNKHNGSVIDPKRFDPRYCMDVKDVDFVIIPPNSFVLACSLETVHMPDDVTGIVLGKSTYARCGIDTLCTPLEAGWKGQITLEFSNNTPMPVKMYAEEGAVQVLFFRGNKCDTTYAMRSGKYQNQTGVTLPIISKF